MKYSVKKNKFNINEYDFELTENDLAVIDEIKELIEEEYKENGWVEHIDFDKSPSFWIEYSKLLNTIIDIEIIDDSVIDEIQYEFEEKYLYSTFKEYAKINIEKLEEEENENK